MKFLALVLCVLPLQAAQAPKAAKPAARPAAKASAPAGPVRPDMAVQPVVGAMKSFQAPPRVRFKLSNGADVVLIEDHRFPLVTVRLAVRGGTGIAGLKYAGIMDALAELWTAGTSTRTAKDIAFEADAFGGALSADAEKDAVVLGAFSLSERADRMFALLAEVALDATFPQEEVELRKKNMLEELKVERSQPAFLASVAFNKKLFGQHPYSVVAPTEESIALIDRDRLRTLHKRLLNPAQATLVVAGDVGQDALKAALEKAFAGWKASEEPAGPPLPPPQDTAGPARRVVLVDRPGSAQTVLAMGSLALVEKDPGWFRLLVANQILGGSFAARLMTDLREHKGYTYGIYSRLSPYRSAGVFSVKTQVRTEVTGPALKDILGHLERMRAEPVSADELKQAKNTLAGRFVRDLETQEGLAEAVLHGILCDLPDDHLDVFVRNVQAVTAEDVRKAAQGSFHPQNMLVTVVGDGAKIAAELAAFSPDAVVRVDEDGEDLPAP